MTAKRRLLLGFLLCGVILAVAFILSCDNAVLVKTAQPDDDAADDDASPGDDDDDTAPPKAPTVQKVLSPTTLTYQSIRGTADPSVEIHVTGGLADAQTTADDKGAFCVRVALTDNALNTLSFTAVNKANKTSPATIVKIQQEIVNFSLSGAATASSVSHSEPGDTADKAIDHDYLTWWRNTTQSWYPEACYVPQWLTVKLAKTYWLTEIDIYWGKDVNYNFEYGTNFDVYVNTKDAPAMPPQQSQAPDSAWWNANGYTLVKHVEQAAGQDIEKNTFDLSKSPAQARWVFVALNTGNQKGVWTCANNQTLYTFGVAELEAYGYEEPDQTCP